MRQLVRLIRDRNEGGEYPFVAGGLFLSFQLSRSLELELRTADSRWSGRSYRGDVKVMLPGEPRCFRHQKAARFAHLTVPEPLLASLGASAAALRPHVILTDTPLRHLLEAWLIEEDADGGADRGPSRLFAEGMLLAILGRLSALNGGSAAVRRGGLPPVLFRRARELIEANLGHDVSVATLAHACGLSTSHFAALFKASAGEPPHRYQTRRRVERARELLIAGCSPALAALTVGFCDQSHLARHLRKLTGHSPSHWHRMSEDRPSRRRNVLERSSPAP